MKRFSIVLFFIATVSFFPSLFAQQGQRQILDFDSDWSFHLGDIQQGEGLHLDDSKWRKLNVPHDWSIEGQFSKDNPATPEGGALPGGIGWYRKSFMIPATSKDKLIYISFDGVYQMSEVWVNGHYLGFRPNGYISFRYELTPYLKFGKERNVIAVKVDNSLQPNSRWYSGSGIYRNVWLVTTGKIAVDHWGSYATTPKISSQSALVNVKTKIRNATGNPQTVTLSTAIQDTSGKQVAIKVNSAIQLKDSVTEVSQDIDLSNPVLWSVDRPFLYKVITKIISGNAGIDEYKTSLGIRSFNFDPEKGFSLNGKPMKILGVCNHHDLGALGAAINTRAIERQLEIMKAMGVNGIRTSHNPPAPELLDLCDKMGFIVIDEAFDVWEKAKKPFDYHLYYKEWHKRDLEDQLLRDRNHPSVMIWSVGNEIPEQRDTIGKSMAIELAKIVHSLDTTRPITTANNNPDKNNQIIQSGALDLVGYNYHHKDLPTLNEKYPGKTFIGTETTSALETRGIYDMPSDSIRRWAGGRRGIVMNNDFTVSAYDNVSAPWGSTHEEAWKIYKKYDFLSGMFIWTGFDYIGEPTPYTWPARSSYFGIVDLAGIAKDVYYMYQSEWTNTPVLHIFPHWNWPAGKIVDVWAYYNNADDVELFLNGISQGIKKKTGDDLHVMWRLTYQPGTLRAISRKNGKTVLTREVKTAGKATKIILGADRQVIKADGKDLSFVTIKVVDQNGTLVPKADNLLNFKLDGEATLAGVDNGDPINHDSFKANYRKAYNGIAMAILQSKQKAGRLTFTATSDGLLPASVTIETK